MWNNLTEAGRGKDADLNNFGNVESVKLKAKETVHNITVDKVVSHGYIGYILVSLYMYAGIEQLSKWMADGGSQLSHCRSSRF